MTAALVKPGIIYFRGLSIYENYGYCIHCGFCVFAADIRLPNPQTAFRVHYFMGHHCGVWMPFFSFLFFASFLFFLFYLLSERGLFVCFAVFACRLCINCGVREDSPLFPLLRRERWNNKQRDLSHCVTCDLIGFMPTYDARQRGKIAVREHFRSILLQLQPATLPSPSTDPRDLCNVRKSVPNRVCHWLWLCKVFNYVCG